MDIHERFAEGYEEAEYLGNDGGRPAGVTADGADPRRGNRGFARQRVEQLEEEEWLKRQLSDWDDLDLGDEDEFRTPI